MPVALQPRNETQGASKVKRYPQILAEEFLYARVYDSDHARRVAIGVWVNYYNYYRSHTACSDQPPATRVRTV